MIPAKLWNPAIHNWEVRCDRHSMRPPFEWALEFEYVKGGKQRIELSSKTKHTATFDLYEDTLRDLLTCKRDWVDYLRSDEVSYMHDAADEQLDELFATLEFFYV